MFDAVPRQVSIQSCSQPVSLEVTGFALAPKELGVKIVVCGFIVVTKSALWLTIYLFNRVVISKILE